MANNILINGTIQFTPNEIEEDIYPKILDKINKKYIKCNMEHGYVLKIQKIDKKFSVKINNNTSNIIFYIKFIAQRILPEVDKILTCKVQAIFNHGIFAQIEDKIKIIIPIASLSKFSYIKDGNETFPDTPIFYSEKRTIHKDMYIKIQIIDVKYAKNRYNCIGKLV